MSHRVGVIIKFIGVLIALAFGAVLVTPQLRELAQSKIRKNERIILAVTNATLDESGKIYQIIKVKTTDGLYIEVFSANVLIASAKLPDKKDGYFTYNGQATNLAVDDINNDSFKEILATSFDDNMVAHLNVYRLVKDQKTLEAIELN
ncbi:MAG: hypothetical protein IPM57_04980 [Oligoflexia bacterium]|nr:hypothetical protein [Oligoflexia bacterium]